MTNIKNELISHSNLYVWTQINFAYHPNKIEGSKLSKDQTIRIFETNDLTMDSDDALETQNHFRLFDYMLRLCHIIWLIFNRKYCLIIVDK